MPTVTASQTDQPAAPNTATLTATVLGQHQGILEHAVAVPKWFKADTDAAPLASCIELVSDGLLHQHVSLTNYFRITPAGRLYLRSLRDAQQARKTLGYVEGLLEKANRLLERIDGSAPLSLSAVTEEFPHLAESIAEVRQYIENR